MASDPWDVIWAFVREADWSGTDNFVRELRAHLTAAGYAIVPVGAIERLRRLQDEGRKADANKAPVARLWFQKMVAAKGRLVDEMLAATARDGQDGEAGG